MFDSVTVNKRVISKSGISKLKVYFFICWFIMR